MIFRDWKRFIQMIYKNDIEARIVILKSKSKRSEVLWSANHKGCGYKFLCINQSWWHRSRDTSDLYRKLSGYLATRYPHRPAILRAGHEKSWPLANSDIYSNATWLLWVLVRWISFIDLVPAIQLPLVLVAFTFAPFVNKTWYFVIAYSLFSLPGRSE